MSTTILPGNSLQKYVELAALVVPQRKLGLRDRIRRACGFLPMPLSLGWDSDPEDEDFPVDSQVPGLLLSDIASGATRVVTAHWMHALYKHIVDTHDAGTIALHLQEAGYTTQFGWGHTMLLSTFVIQLSFILFAITHNQRREGWLILAAGLIRISEGLLAWAHPKHEDPRATDRVSPRFCALHTGMTTNYILVITHRFGVRGKCINLEDAAVPKRNPEARSRHIRRICWLILKISVWTQKGASIVTSADGFTIPLVLLLGTSVLEFVSYSAEMLPSVSAVTVLSTGSSILDRVTAACQFTGAASVGFVESILPDPRGLHTDYNWILNALDTKNLTEKTRIAFKFIFQGSSRYISDKIVPEPV
ncbi:hypothetical protein C8R44DRAFT_903839 [Mycena epipterygia]|nr:hypothetical protein C8R44DRAFT_903839 [Mycena epipterygia]